MPEIATPKISVLIPVCNVEKYLAACLNSALNQQFSDIEIICINDGSTDKSLDILKKYKKRDPRIVIIDKDNAGYGAALNSGLEKASGKYIAILESDDRVHPKAWKALYDQAEEHDLDFIRGNYYKANKGQEQLFEVNRIVDRACPESLPEMPYYTVGSGGEYPRCFFINPSIWAGLYKREFIESEDIRFNETPGASYQDTSFAFKIWATAKRIMLIEEPIIYYTTDNAASSSKSTKKVFAVCDEMKECTTYLDRINADSMFYQVLASIRYKTYKWNLNRIASEYHQEFRDVANQEIIEDYRTGRTSPMYLRRSDYEQVKALADGAPAVSIIVPVYNAENYLEDCINSVLRQTFTDFELICINDGSTDNSLALLNDYAREDSRIIVLDKEKTNAGAARNAALKIAKGTYLAFLDADDYYEPEMLMQMIELANRFDLDIALCRSYLLDDKTKKVRNHVKKMLDTLTEKTLYSAEDLWGLAFRYAVGWPWDKIFRRSFIESHELEFQELDSTNDAYFVYVALALANRFAFTDNRLITHRVNNMLSIENSRDKSWLNFFSAAEAIKQKLQDSNVYEAAKVDFKNWMAEMIIWSLRNLHSAKADFYAYVKSNYLDDLMSLSDEEYYEDYAWRLKVWKECDYELASSIFALKNELYESQQAKKGLRKILQKAKGGLKIIKKPLSHLKRSTLARSLRR